MPRISRAALTSAQARALRNEARRFVDSLGLDPQTRGAALRVYVDAKAHEMARGIVGGKAGKEVLEAIRRTTDRTTQSGSVREALLCDEFERRSAQIARAQRADERERKRATKPERQTPRGGEGYKVPDFLSLRP